MNSTPKVELHPFSMLCWVIGAGGVACLVGLLPTWMISGLPGLHCMLAGGGTALAGNLFCGFYVLRAARCGPGRAAFGFVIGGVFASIFSLTGAGFIWSVWDFPAVELFLWTAVFNFFMLVGLSLWLYKGLRRDAKRVALGRIQRSSDF